MLSVFPVPWIPINVLEKKDILLATIQNLLQFLGFDRAVSYGILARLWGIISGPVSMLLIAARFSKEQQGYYYTFGSLLGLQIFFELGLLFVIAQFASHEFVHLRWYDRGRIQGDPVALGRFTDLLSNTTIWFGIAALLLVIGLVPAGFYFFGQEKSGVLDFAWRLPWVLAVVGTALNLLVTPFFAVIMGSGDVVTVNHREMVGGIISSFLAWLVIGGHGGLYAVFAATLGNVFISWSYLIRQKPELLRLVWREIFKSGSAKKKEAALSWWGEIWPIQWRMAISSGSSYFIFQLFNPILFHYHGAVVSGQMGMTLTAASVLLGVCSTMINAKSPEFGKLIAVRDWNTLDRRFSRVLYQSISMAVLGALCGWGAIWYLQGHHQIGERFIPAFYAAILLATVCVQIVNSAFAVYLRAHKREPLMVMTMVSSVLQGAATWLFGKYYSTLGVTVAYFSVTTFFIFPYIFIVWKRCQSEWHTA
jgi:O-antigen/teichoic acid export membrane protein